MAITLSINNTTCIKCGKCVRVCPSRIFTQEKPGEEIGIPDISNCISCGHCAAVCPTESIMHSEFPPEKVHAIDRAQLPTAEQMMLLCKARRSNRAFSKKPVPEEVLGQILEAAHRAPTASNMQQVEFTLVTDPERLKEISQFTIDTFAEIAKKLVNPFLKPILKPMLPQLYRYLPAFHRLTDEYAKGNDLILRGATAVLFIHTPKKSKFGCQDANLAYQNGSLMAECLGVSQFYTGFVCSAIQQDNKLAKSLGIQGTIHAGMGLGMPSFLYPNYIDKKEIQVNRL